MRIKENAILLISKSTSFFRNILKSIKKLIIPDIEVAKATPPIFKGNMKIEFRIILSSRAIPATFAGVTVSLSAKKQDCSIFVEP